MTIDFKDLKLTESEQNYIKSRAVRKYVDGNGVVQAWFDIFLEELAKAGYTLEKKEST